MINGSTRAAGRDLSICLVKLRKLFFWEARGLHRGQYQLGLARPVWRRQNAGQALPEVLDYFRLALG